MRIRSASLITEASVVAVVAPGPRRTLALPFPEEAVLHDCDAVRGSNVLHTVSEFV